MPQWVGCLIVSTHFLLLYSCFNFSHFIYFHWFTRHIPRRQARINFFKYMCFLFHFESLILFFLLVSLYLLLSVGCILDRWLDSLLWFMAFDCLCHSCISIHFLNHAIVSIPTFFLLIDVLYEKTIVDYAFIFIYWNHPWFLSTDWIYLWTWFNSR